MLDIKKKFYDFLLPQVSVAVVFLATVLITIHSIVFLFKFKDLNLITLSPIYILFLILCVQILYKNKHSKFGYLWAAQSAGTVLISTICVFYVVRKLEIYNMQSLSYLDIFFLVFAAVTIIRFIIIFTITFYGDELSVLRNISRDFFKHIPDAKYNAFDNRLIYVAALFSIIFYFYYSKNSINTSYQIIVLGESLFVGMLIIDLFEFVKHRNKPIKRD